MPIGCVVGLTVRSFIQITALWVDSIGRRNTLIMEVLDDGNSRLGQEDQ